MSSYCSCLAVIPPQPNHAATSGRSSRSTAANALPLEPWPSRTIIHTDSSILIHYHHTTETNSNTSLSHRSGPNNGRRKQSAGQQQKSSTATSGKNTIPDYHFSHLLHTGDHISNYRRTCSSVSSMPPTYVTTAARRTLDDNKGPASNHNHHRVHHMITKKQPPLALREKPTERRSADVNYVLFQYPNRNDNSFSYRPLLFARGSFPGNNVSKLLAEYWSSASSTVESVMKVRGSGVGELLKESSIENKDESSSSTSHTSKSTITEEPTKSFKEDSMLNSSADKMSRETEERCHCTLTKKPPLGLIDVPPLKTNKESIIQTNDLKNTNNDKLINRDISTAKKMDYPVFTTDDGSVAEDKSSDKKVIASSIYSNPFEYSKEGGGEDSIGHKTSGRLLAARMRAISDSGITSDHTDDDINDTLQSKSLLKTATSCSSQTIYSSGESSGIKPDHRAAVHLRTVQPSNSLPNIFNISYLGRQTNALPPPIGYYNRDLLYVGIEPGCKASSATTEVNVPVSVSARVKHRLTLNTPLLPDATLPTKISANTNATTVATSAVRKQPKRRHTARCFKRSLNRRRASVTNKWIFVESYNSQQRTNVLPTLDDVLNAE